MARPVTKPYVETADGREAELAGGGKTRTRRGPRERTAETTRAWKEAPRRAGRNWGQSVAFLRGICGGIRGTARMITKRSSGLGWTQGNGLLCLGRQGLTPARLVSRLRTAARPSYRGVVLRSLWMEDGLRRDAGAGCRTRAHGHVTVPLMPIAIRLWYMRKKN